MLYRSANIGRFNECMCVQAIMAAIDHQRLQEFESASKDKEIACLKGHLAQIQVRITRMCVRGHESHRCMELNCIKH
jgi:hypothetical protein